MFLESKAYVYKAQPPAYINYDPTIMHGSDARTTGAALQLLLFFTLIDLRQFFCTSTQPNQSFSSSNKLRSWRLVPLVKHQQAPRR